MIHLKSRILIVAIVALTAASVYLPSVAEAASVKKMRIAPLTSASINDTKPTKQIAQKTKATKNDTHLVEVKGMVLKVSADSITILTSSAKQHKKQLKNLKVLKFGINEETLVIGKSGDVIPNNSIHRGDRVSVWGTKTHNGVAVLIQNSSVRVVQLNGIVTGVKPASSSFSMDSVMRGMLFFSTVVTNSDTIMTKDLHAIRLTDLAAGDRVTVEGIWNSSKNQILANRVIVDVNGTSIAPVATIIAPITGTKYTVGQPVSFSGSCTDVFNLPLANCTLSWQVDMIDGSDVMTVLGPTDPSTSMVSGSYTPMNDEVQSSTTKVRITLTATNGAQTATTSKELSPKTVMLTVKSTPIGLQFMVDDAVRTNLFTMQAVVGSTHTVEAISSQTLNGKTYDFNSWSDAGAAAHTITVPSINTTYNVTYVVISPPATSPSAPTTTKL